MTLLSARAIRYWLVAIGFWVPSATAQKPVQSVTGIVRAIADSGAPLAGVDVVIGNRKATTNERGAFRIDSLSPGQYPLIVRRIGYRAIYGRVPVVLKEPTRLEYYMMPAPYLLPTLVVESQRTGIYGVVVDSSLQPLLGAKVAVMGYRGDQMLTDSAGRFAFPNAKDGDYLVSVTSPGYAERRLGVEVPRGKGREMSFRLVPQRWLLREPGVAEALWDLSRRLATTFRRGRMTASELRRFGSMRLCDVPKLISVAGDPTTVVLNGVRVLRRISLCHWRMDEIELIELCGTGCPNPDFPMPLMYADPSGRKQPIAIAIWEKR